MRLRVDGCQYFWRVKQFCIVARATGDIYEWADLNLNKSAPAFLTSGFLMPHASRFVRVVYALLLYHKIIADDRNDTGLTDGYAVTLDNGSHLRM